MSRANLFDLLKKTASSWSDHDAPRLGAALAFYALLSLAPLAILVVAICGLVLNKSTAEQQLLSQVAQVIGPSAAKTVKSLVDNTSHVKSGVIASSIALVTLMFGASGVFSELQDSLNTIWQSKPGAQGVQGFLKRRLFCFAMVVSLGILLLLSLFVSAAIGFLEHFFMQFVPAGTATLSEILNVLISLAAIAVLFALIFKFVPDAPIDWQDVTVGAVVTAILFTLGRMLLAFYLATAGVGSTYGAAGSLVALVVWVYYSAQIFFFGAIFTRVYADTYGSLRHRKPRKTISKGAPAIN